MTTGQIIVGLLIAGLVGWVCWYFRKKPWERGEGGMG